VEPVFAHVARDHVQGFRLTADAKQLKCLSGLTILSIGADRSFRGLLLLDRVRCSFKILRMCLGVLAAFSADLPPSSQCCFGASCRFRGYQRLRRL